jgi:membrane-associated phospholipid phosphatase
LPKRGIRLRIKAIWSRPLPPHAKKLPGQTAIKALRSVRLRSSLVLAAALYVSAVGASALLNIQARILAGVPLFVSAVFLIAWRARIMFPRAARFQCVLEALIVTVVLGLSLACLSYAGAAVDLPLRDAEIVWLDRQLGFDWSSVMTSLDHSSLLPKILDGAYATFTAQLVGIVFLLAVTMRMRELDCFFVSFVCASIIAEGVSVLVPTLGPMSVLATGAQFANLPSIGHTTAEITLALRTGALRTIDFAALNGIISFPSLHAAVAILAPYALRWNKLLLLPIAALDSVMLVSCVPSGNHYLADVICGAAIAVVAILCAPTIQSSIETRCLGSGNILGLKSFEPS